MCCTTWELGKINGEKNQRIFCKIMNIGLALWNTKAMPKQGIESQTKKWLSLAK